MLLGPIESLGTLSSADVNVVDAIGVVDMVGENVNAGIDIIRIYYPLHCSLRIRLVTSESTGSAVLGRANVFEGFPPLVFHCSVLWFMMLL